MIECEAEEIAQNVGQLMKDTANQLFNGEFAHVTVKEIGCRRVWNSIQVIHQSKKKIYM